MQEKEMKTTTMDNSVKEFCYTEDKRNGKVAGRKHGARRDYFNMVSIACLYAGENKLII